MPTMKDYRTKTLISDGSLQTLLLFICILFKIPLYWKPVYCTLLLS